MQETLLTALGAAIVAFALADIVMTVLSISGREGPLTAGVSWVVGSLTRVLPDRRVGPLVVFAMLLAWGALPVLGFALIYQPQLGTGIVSGGSPVDTSFLSALYLSWYSFTTLGLGDLKLMSHTVRMLVVAESALGFVILTLGISFLLSVYSSSVQCNAIAERLTSVVDDDPAAAAGSVDAGSLLQSLTSELAEVHSMHRKYPVVRHFGGTSGNTNPARLTEDTRRLIEAGRAQSPAGDGPYHGAYSRVALKLADKIDGLR